MTRRRRPTAVLARWTPVLVVLLPLVLLAFDALARPGGGHTYRGGGRSGGGSFGGGHGGGGGGGGDDGALVVWLIIQLIVHPEIGIPVLLVLVIAMILNRIFSPSWRNLPGWDTGESFHAHARPRPQSPRRALERLGAFDPDFSLVLFEDFLYALYAHAHEARGRGALARLSPWLSQEARTALESTGLREVKAIVVGSVRYLSVDPPATAAATARVTVRFESNYTEVTTAGEERGYYAVEEWALMRRAGARSRPPDRTRTFQCPNCGAPLEGVQGSTCSYCKQVVDTGEFDWVVSSVTLLERETRGPQLTGDVQEEGTDLPTVADPEANERFGALAAKDPALSWPAFRQRVSLIHRSLASAWSSRSWKDVRPFVTDALFQTQLYWIGTYERQHLRNVLENGRVLDVQNVRVTSDRFYDAITVRLHATGLDYTVDDSGRVVSGSRSREREYSEYWTLVRGRNASGAPRTEPICPNCGAPLDIEMTGACVHCRAKVTSGEFDWILSRIEQDEAYTS